MPRPIARLDASNAQTRAPLSRRFLLGVWGVLLLAVLAAGALRSASREDAAPAGSDARVARGKYLVSRMSAQDRESVYAYLRTIEQERSRVASSRKASLPERSSAGTR